MSLKQLLKRHSTTLRKGISSNVLYLTAVKLSLMASLLNAYRVLRTLNPSPYMFYLSGGDVELTGASPETLVKLTDGKMYTFPIAGTMRRGKNEAEDLAIEEKLINDEKELAEHNMLVDLGRNDLGKIAKFGSVKVEALHMLQRFSHVIHITSTVSGDIQTAKMHWMPSVLHCQQVLYLALLKFVLSRFYTNLKKAHAAYTAVL